MLMGLGIFWLQRVPILSPTSHPFHRPTTPVFLSSLVFPYLLSQTLLWSLTDTLAPSRFVPFHDVTLGIPGRSGNFCSWRLAIFCINVHTHQRFPKWDMGQFTWLFACPQRSPQFISSGRNPESNVGSGMCRVPFQNEVWPSSRV